jgi:O-antigen ligase
VGLFLILFLFAASTIYFKIKSAWPKIAWPLAYFIIPISIAFFSANLVLDNAVKSQEVQGGYGTVSKRIDDITANTKEESRLRLWKAGLDYTSKHPFIGDGYGNWKLASIPYEKEYTNDLFVPYHAHNDFIEAAADLGILGGLAYLGLFILAFLFTIRLWVKEDAKEFRLFATISFMALTCYFVDAFLNFPTERTSMQTMLTLTAGLLFAPAYFLKKQEPIPDPTPEDIEAQLEKRRGIQKELSGVVDRMKTLAKEFSNSKGTPRGEEIKNELKSLTSERNDLQKQLDAEDELNEGLIENYERLQKLAGI